MTIRRLGLTLLLLVALLLVLEPVFLSKQRSNQNGSAPAPAAGAERRLVEMAGRLWHRWDDFVGDVRHALRQQFARLSSPGRGAAPITQPLFDVELQAPDERTIADPSPAVADGTPPSAAAGPT